MVYFIEPDLKECIIRGIIEVSAETGESLETATNFPNNYYRSFMYPLRHQLRQFLFCATFPAS